MAHITSRKHTVAAAPQLKNAALGLMIAALPAAALAQNTTPAAPAAAPKAEQQLAPVTVRGSSESDIKATTSASPKATAPLIDTPQTITVVKKELLDQQGAITLQDALRNTPGVTLLLGEGGNSNTKDNIFMRGFDTSGSIYSDGVRDLGGYVRDMFNIEQVEVVKGSSGSDYGRGAPSGSINTVSKAPRAENFQAGSAAVGTADQYRVTGDINQQIGANAAVRLNLMGQSMGVAGRDEVKNEGWGIAPSVAFGLGTPTRFTLSYLHAEQDNVPDGGVPTVGLDGYRNAAGVRASRVDPNNFYGSTSDYAKVQADQLTLLLEHDLGPRTTLRNTTRAGRSVLDQLVTGPSAVVSDGSGASAVFRLNPATWEASRSRQLRWQENIIITNQTNVNSVFNIGSMENTLSTGVEFIYEEQTTRGLTGAGVHRSPGATGSPNDSRTNLWNPRANDPVTGMNVSRTGVDSKGDTFTVALYAFDTLKITDRWQVNGGLRFDRFTTSNTNVGISGTPAVTTVTNISGSDTLLTWKAGVLFKPAANGSVYLSTATSQQPPGGSSFALSTATTGNGAINNPSMDPSKATTHELGTKWDLFGDKLALTAAIYNTEVTNDTSVDINGVATQYGKKTVKGVELGAVGYITNNWSVSTGLAHMKTDVEEGSAGQQGANLNWSPEWSFTAWTTYRLPFNITIGGGARYMDSTSRSVSNSVTSTTNMAYTEEYWVFDAYAAYAVNRNLTLQLNLYNLADERYIANLNNNGGRYTPGAGRSALLTANVKF
ncbi:MAG: catecholate siderophore receptor Fiu [Moraxellaceae bacterium]|nr:catecholate siderophore receptor Fiu [Moraxellaceae bacterium]